MVKRITTPFKRKKRGRVDFIQLLNVCSNLFRAGLYLIVNKEELQLFLKQLLENII